MWKWKKIQEVLRLRINLQRSVKVKDIYLYKEGLKTFKKTIKEIGVSL